KTCIIIDLLLLFVPSAQQPNESTLFKIARVLERFDYIASIIVNANHSIMRSAVKFCVSDGVIRLDVPEPPEWQRVGVERLVRRPHFAPHSLKLRDQAQHGSVEAGSRGAFHRPMLRKGC